jgi:hypothetical protein
MRRRLVWAFSLLCTATALAACGDTGDHFGEFRKNPPSPAVASKIAIAMPIIAGPKTPSGNFKLYVTAYISDGTAVPVGTQLQNPIVINSNDPKGVLFGSKKLTVLQFTAAPGPISVSYHAEPYPCTKPVAAVTAFNHDADPQVVDMKVVACPTPKPAS